MRAATEGQIVVSQIKELEESILSKIAELQYWCVINKFASEKETIPYFIQGNLCDLKLNTLVYQLCKENSNESYFYFTSTGHVCLKNELLHLSFDDFIKELKKYESDNSRNSTF